MERVRKQRIQTGKIYKTTLFKTIKILSVDNDAVNFIADYDRLYIYTSTLDDLMKIIIKEVKRVDK